METSLEVDMVDMQRGVPVSGIHHYNLKVINTIRRYSNFAKAV